MDLAEAPASWRGAGLGVAGSSRAAAAAEALGASLGATRVVTDRGWVGHERQIGTTGVVVDPRLYLAFGISGAVQHTSGLGQPDHIISVNTDPSCPMMQLADLAVVSDANAVLDELVARLAPAVGSDDARAAGA
jgi:electron transfer flavoprotein alpha subunit